MNEIFCNVSHAHDFDLFPNMKLSFVHVYIDELWANYPGPVLSGWDELPMLLASFNADAMDALQKGIVEWHQQMKKGVKAYVYDSVIKAVERSVGAQ